jgi:DNA-directed RNA polymerase subunit H
LVLSLSKKKSISSKPSKEASAPEFTRPSILEHELVPKHEVLSKEEVEELLKKYKASLNQLPQILINDPVVRELGAKIGDVIKITRNSPTAGTSVYYRVVVSEA